MRLLVLVYFFANTLMASENPEAAPAAGQEYVITDFVTINPADAINPLSNITVFYGLLAGLFLLGLLVILVSKWQWSGEKYRVRKAISKALGMNPADTSSQNVLPQILTLVPCCLISSADRVWFCFLKQRLLLVWNEPDRVKSLPYSKLKALRLVDDPLTLRVQVGKEDFRVKTNHLADMARIVNVCIDQNVVLGFQNR